MKSESKLTKGNSTRNREAQKKIRKVTGELKDDVKSNTS